MKHLDSLEGLSRTDFHQADEEMVPEHSSQALTAKQRAWVRRLRLLVQDADDESGQLLKAYKDVLGRYI